MNGNDATQIDGTWSDFRNYAYLSVIIYVGVFLHALNIFITATTIPSIVREIGGGELINWVTAVYILMTIVTSAVGPGLMKTLGLKPTLLLGGLTFALGGALCAASNTMTLFLAGRLFQGIGAGTLLVVSYFLIGTSIPDRLRAKAFAIVGCVFSIAMLVGPSVGGLLTAVASWRFAYLSMVVLSLAHLGGIGIIRTPLGNPDTYTARPGGIPLLGYVVGVICCVSLVLLANRIDDLLPGVLIATSALIALYFLVAVYRRERFGVLHPKILCFGNEIGLASWILFLLSASTYSFSIYGSLLSQNILGLSVTASGYLVGANALSMTTGEVVIASMSKQRRQSLLTFSQVLILLGLCAVGYSLRDASLELTLLSVVVAGFGCGFSWTAVSELIGQSADGQAGLNAASSIPSIQMLGVAVGSALYGMIASSFEFDENSSAMLAKEFSFWVHVLPAAIVCLAIVFAMRIAVQRAYTR